MKEAYEEDTLMRSMIVRLRLIATARQTSLLSKFEAKSGGGGGNRTRVREPSDRASTYIACVLNSPLRPPTGRIPKRLSYKVSPLSYRRQRETILFF